MNENDFNEISMNGRMAYLILCIEKYLISKYPNDDWSVLSKWMWRATSEPWDEWNDRFMEIIPEYLFEFDSFESADFDNLSFDEYEYFTNLLKNKSEELYILLLKLHELQEIYCYESIPGNGLDASKLLIESCKILEKNSIPIPDINLVSFSSFSEKNGWGNDFDGVKLSIILNP